MSELIFRLAMLFFTTTKWNPQAASDLKSVYLTFLTSAPMTPDLDDIDDVVVTAAASEQMIGWSWTLSGSEADGFELLEKRTAKLMGSRPSRPVSHTRSVAWPRFRQLSTCKLAHAAARGR